MRIATKFKITDFGRRVFLCFLSIALVLCFSPSVDAMAIKADSDAKVEKTSDANKATEKETADEAENASETTFKQAKAEEEEEVVTPEVTKQEQTEDKTSLAPSVGFANGLLLSSAAPGSETTEAKTGVCKLVKSSKTTYHTTLDSAISEAGTEEDATIYIYKSTTLLSSCTISGNKNITIANIVEPESDDENPTKNGSADSQPVVRFSKYASITFSGTSGDKWLEGVIFDGGNEERTTPAITMSASYALCTKNGDANSTAGILSTPVTFRNFSNTTDYQASVFQANSGRICLVNADICNNGNTSKVSSAIYNSGATIDYGFYYSTLSGQPSMHSNCSKNAGAIFNASGTLNLSHGSISNNSAYSEGGAIRVGSGTANLNGTNFSSNEVTNGSGGVVYTTSSSATVNISAGELSNNKAARWGGALYLESGTFKISGGEITNNFAVNCGVGYIGGTSPTTRISGGVITGNKNSASNSPALQVMYGICVMSGSVKIINNGVAASQTSAITTKADFMPGSNSVLKVGTMNEDANVGIFSTGSLCNKGVTFANVSSGTATSVSDTLRKVFYNDKNTVYFATPVDTTGTGITWDEGVCKLSYQVSASTDPVVQTFLTIQEAFTAVASLNASYTMKTGDYVGYFPIEILINEVTLTSAQNLSAGSTKPVLLTTAKASATDGYPYRGDTSKESGRAVIKRAFNNTSATQDTVGAFSMVAVKSSSNLTLKNCILDGNNDNSYYGSCGGGVNVNSGCSFTMDNGATIRNSTEGISTNTSGSFDGGGVYVGGSSSSTTTFAMKEGSSIEGCVGRRGGGLFTAQYSTATINGGTIKDCYKSGANNQYGGGIFFQGTLALSGKTKVANNKATNGGALCFSKTTANLTVKDQVEISGNITTSSSMGCVCFFDGSARISTMIVEGSPRIYNNWGSAGESGAVQQNFTENASTDSDSAYGGNLKVGSAGLTKDAKIGVFPVQKYNSGEGFATTTTTPASSSTNAKYLCTFVNDKDSTLVGKAASDSTNSVVWTKALVKVVNDSTGAQVFSTIAEAVTYLGTVTFSSAFASNGGVAKIEILVNEISQTEAVSVSLGSSKPICLTTASTSATDGYSYRGDTSKESGRAVVKRGFTGSTTETAGCLFYLSNLSKMTIENIVVDGNKTTYSSDTANARRGFYLTPGTQLTFNRQAHLRNSDTGKSSSGGSLNGGGICVPSSGTSSNLTKITMNSGSKISDCTSTSSGAGIYLYDYGTITLDGAEMSNCVAQNSSNAGGILTLYSRGSTINIKDSTIKQCSAAGGSAIFSYGAVNLSGSTKITNNTSSASNGAIFMTHDSGYTPALTISDTVQITNNTGTGSASDGKGTAVYLNGSGNTIVLSGSPTIYDNKDGNGNQANVYESTDANVGTKIKVASAGLNTNAKIGVYSKNNAASGYKFAATVAAAGATKGLGRFINDVTSTLSGVATGTNSVMWSDAVCKIEPSTAGGTPTYYNAVHTAIAAATDGQTVTVFKDNSSMSTANQYPMSHTGTVTLRDELASGIDWTGSLATTSTGALNNAAWRISQGTLVMDGFRMDASACIYNDAPICVQGGKLKIQGDTYLVGHMTGGNAATIGLYGSAVGTLEMTGGTITGSPTGIFIWSTLAHNVSISGGTITGNGGTNTYAGGIVVCNASSNATVTVSGSAKITGNKRSGVDCNVDVSRCTTSGSAARLYVGNLNSDANVGVYSDKYTAGEQFGTGTTTATSLTNIKRITNDRNANAKAAAGSGTAVIWSETVCKVVTGTGTSATPNVFTTLQAAFDFIAAITTDFDTKFPSGVAKIEMLTGEYSLPSMIQFNAAYDREIVLTTASSTATDSYPYRGAAADNEGRAVIKRTVANGMFDCRKSMKLTFDNVVIDGANISPGWSGAIVCCYGSSPSTIKLQNNVTFRNSLNTGKGAAIAAFDASDATTASNIIIKNSSIEDCTGVEGAAIWVGKYSTLELDGATIKGCTSTGALSGGNTNGSSIIVVSSNSTATIKGASKITGNSSANGTVFCLANSTTNITGTTKITDNAFTDAAKGAVYFADSTGKVVLSGSPTISNNKSSAGTAINVADSTAQDVASQIEVGTDGMNSDASVGIYSENNESFGEAFAHTASDSAEKSTNAKYLNTFKNDKNSNLLATFGTGNKVIWASNEWLDLTVALPDTGSGYDKTWFVVELKDMRTGDVYRQPICVEGKTAGASATEAVLVSAGVPYEISIKSNNGSWRFGFSSASLDGACKSTDSWSTTVSTGSTASGTLKLVSSSSLATGQHALKITTKQTNDKWLDSHIGVTNTSS